MPAIFNTIDEILLHIESRHPGLAILKKPKNFDDRYLYQPFRLEDIHKLIQSAESEVMECCGANTIEELTKLHQREDIRDHFLNYGLLNQSPDDQGGHRTLHDQRKKRYKARIHECD